MLRPHVHIVSLVQTQNIRKMPLKFHGSFIYQAGDYTEDAMGSTANPVTLARTASFCLYWNKTDVLSKTVCSQIPQLQMGICAFYFLILDSLWVGFLHNELKRFDFGVFTLVNLRKSCWLTWKQSSASVTSQDETWRLTDNPSVFTAAVKVSEPPNYRY